MTRLLSIIVPVFNEENTIEFLLTKVAKAELPSGIEKEIIVVNDCSKDKTGSVLEELMKQAQLPMKVFNHEVNRGKGAAIRTGIQHATGEFIVVQDADLEYDPNEYSILLAPILQGHADVVYGSRFAGGNPHRILFFWHTIGNKFLTFVSNMFTNLNLTDMESCYKMFRSDVLKRISLNENRFGFEPEVTAKVAKQMKRFNTRIYEVGISYYGRTYAEGKKINWKDGVRAIYCIIKYNLL